MTEKEWVDFFRLMRKINSETYGPFSQKTTNLVHDTYQELWDNAAIDGSMNTLEDFLLLARDGVSP